MSYSPGSLATCLSRVSRYSLSELPEIFSPWIVVPQTFGLPGRRRLFSPLVGTFWLFLSEVLSADRSCRQTVRKALAWLALRSGKTASPNTAAYCKARARLILTDIDAVLHQSAERIQHLYAPEHLWYGRRVKIIDGTGLSMPDTQANREAYRPSKHAKDGCGFPLMKLVVLFCLSTGLILEVAKGTIREAERTLARRLWGLLDLGDVLLADRGFTGYADFFCLTQRGVDCVMKNHQRRTKRLAVVKKISKGDHLILWYKTRVRPKWLSPKQWRAIPNTINLRQIAFHVNMPGFRTKTITVVTTLLDYRIYPKEAFADLYRRRWMAELFLRDIKTTMGMDILRCKSPEMVHKEISMYLIAYNLIRALMLEAASRHGVSPLRISFKGTIATVRQWAPIITAPRIHPSRRQRLIDILLAYLARDILPHRPNRSEPRARKRRPKNYQLLTKPRSVFKECPHRNYYRRRLS
ncbi:MAG: IS4 family transposase [Candidatus Eisenbacteria bacterium]